MPPYKPNGFGLPQRLVNEMQAIFGKHPGYRTTHAKGILLEGHFKPTEKAKTITVAPHFSNSSTKVLGRFSVGGGIPHIPDADTDVATPKGIGLRFLIDKDTHTDIICHSFNGFAARTGEDFLQFLQVFRQSKLGPEQAAAFKEYLGAHPAAANFVLSPKPNPVSFGTLTYYGVNTHVLTNKEEKKTNIRYRLIPAEGDKLLSDQDAKTAPSNYLEDELAARLPSKPIVFTLAAQIAEADDVLDDATIPYKSTQFVSMGTLTLKSICEDNAALQKEVAFSPVPGGVDGIELSEDPLIITRAGVYYISASQRRSEKQTE